MVMSPSGNFESIGMKTSCSYTARLPLPRRFVWYSLHHEANYMRIMRNQETPTGHEVSRYIVRGCAQSVPSVPVCPGGDGVVLRPQRVAHFRQLQHRLKKRKAERELQGVLQQNQSREADQGLPDVLFGQAARGVQVRKARGWTRAPQDGMSGMRRRYS